jgi:hypothetical protein
MRPASRPNRAIRSNLPSGTDDPGRPLALVLPGSMRVISKEPLGPVSQAQNPTHGSLQRSGRTRAPLAQIGVSPRSTAEISNHPDRRFVEVDPCVKK